MSRAGRIVPVAAIIAVAANTEGRREIIGLGIEAIIQRQQRMPPERNDDRLLVESQHRGFCILWPGRQIGKGGRTVREWVAARNQLAKMFAGRVDA